MRGLTPKAAQFKRGPDEEGIETSEKVFNSVSGLFKRGPDEEGIETSEALHVCSGSVQTRT